MNNNSKIHILVEIVSSLLISCYFRFRFKIKAHPLNKKILHGPLKPTVPIEKKPNTIPEPFKLTEVHHKVRKVATIFCIVLRYFQQIIFIFLF